MANSVQIQQLAGAVTAALKSTSLNKLAEELKVNAATLSKIRDGEYVSDDTFYKTAQLLKVHFDWCIVETIDLRRVKNICAGAQSGAKAYIICDEPGTGKTTGLEEYVRFGVNVYMLSCKNHWSKKDFLKALCKALGISNAGGVGELFDSITETLNKLKQPLVILDEVDKLKEGVIDFINPLYNDCKGRCGLVLTGTPHLRKKIEKGVRLDKMSYKEIYSRANRDFKALNKNAAEVKGELNNNIELICKANGVTNTKTIEKIKTEYDKHCDLRAVKELIENVIR